MMATQSRKHTVLEGRDRTAIRTAEISTPLGAMLAGATDDGICVLEFADTDRSERQAGRLRKLLHAEIIKGTNAHLEALSAQLGEYFAGKRKLFDLPLVMPGTPFQQAAW